MKKKTKAWAVKKYSGVRDDGVLIESNNIDDFRLQDFSSITISETMTRERFEKEFPHYSIPSKGNKK